MSFLYDHLSPGPVVLDASSIINLLGCGDFQGVLEALGNPSLVEEKTFAEVKRHPLKGKDHRTELEQLHRSGLLVVDRMSDEEYDVYLSLVSRPLAGKLGDGESAAIALAHRGHTVILDENKAHGIVAREFAALKQASTYRLLLTAGHRGGWRLDRVQALLLAARANARMGVPRDERDDLEHLMQGFSGWPPF